jgi:hypothetical protein
MCQVADLRADLDRLRDPANIKGAGLASSPYVLRKSFAADLTIHRLIAAGQRVLPLVKERLASSSNGEITLAALAYIVGNVDPKAAAEILGPRFRASVKSPGPFFVHFAAHEIRRGMDLPVDPLKMVYSRGELVETSERLG